VLSRYEKSVSDPFLTSIVSMNEHERAWNASSANRVPNFRVRFGSLIRLVADPPFPSANPFTLYSSLYVSLSLSLSLFLSLSRARVRVNYINSVTALYDAIALPITFATKDS